MGTPQERYGLAGYSILVAEDEPLIVLDVEATLEAAGARVLVSRTVEDALRLASHPSLSAAVLDCRLGDGDVEPVCGKLTGLNLPFVFYTGCTQDEFVGQRSVAPIVHKPAPPERIVGAVRFAIAASKRTGGDFPLAKTSREEMLHLAHRHIVEAEGRIERVRDIILRLAQCGYDTSSAEELLRVMAVTLKNMREHERTIEALRSPENPI